MTRSQRLQGAGSSCTRSGGEACAGRAASRVLPCEVPDTEFAFPSGRAAVRLSTSTQPLTSREMVEFRRGQVPVLSSLIEVGQRHQKWTRSTGMGHNEHCRREQGWSASLLWRLQPVLRLQCFKHIYFFILPLVLVRWITRHDITLCIFGGMLI